MNIQKMNKMVTASFVTVAFVATAVFAAPASAQTSMQDLLAQIAQLQSQIEGLEGVSNAPRNNNVSSNACPYTWSRNLAVGSKGADVRKLQQFLNSDSATQVSTSGAGSAGSETEYYGPATGRAVAKFQEKYSSEILSPVGLSSGTPNFFRSTRAKANDLCSTSSVVSKPRTGDFGGSSAGTASVGDLTLNVGDQERSGSVAEGAQRVVFVSFSLTAEGGNVRIQGVEVEQVGQANSDNFESVALIDASGRQYSSARSFNRDDIARIGGNFDVRRGDTVELFVVGNMATRGDFKSGQYPQLRVNEIKSDEGDISTNFRGPAHTLNALEIGKVTVDVGKSKTSQLDGDGEPIGTKDVIIFEADVEANNREDLVLSTITFTQDGSADPSDLSNIVAELDGEEYDVRFVGDDRYTVFFNNDAVVEENDDVRLEVRADIESGYEETIDFSIDDASDVYAVGRKYEFGVPVVLKQNGGSGDDSISYSKIEIDAGNIQTSNRTGLDSDEFQIGSGSKRLLGANAYEIEDEDVYFENPEFEVVLDLPNGIVRGTTDDDVFRINNSEDLNIDEFVISRAYLEVNGEKVADADDDIEFKATAIKSGEIKVTVEFSGEFTVQADDDENAVFVVRGDLDSDWSNLDDSSIEFTLVGFDEAEAVESDVDVEKDFITDPDATPPTNYGKFEEVDIVGNEVTFSLRDDGVVNDEVVKGADDVVFGTFRIDARDSSDDVRVDDVQFTIVKTGSNSEYTHLNNCQIGNSRSKNVSSTNLTIDLKGYEVEAGETEDLDITCDVDEQANEDDTFEFTVGSTDKVDYVLNRDNYEDSYDGSSDALTVKDSGDVVVTLHSPRDDLENQVAVDSNGENDIVVLEIRLEANSEGAEIKRVLIEDVGIIGTTLDIEDVISGATLHSGNNELDSASTSNLETGNYSVSGLETAIALGTNDTLEFKDVDLNVDVNDRETITLQLELNGINDDDTGYSGQYVSFGNVHVIYEGKASEVVSSKTVSSGTREREAISYKSLLSFATTDETRRRSTGNGRDVYEVELEAGSNDVYVKQLKFNVRLSTGTELAGIQLEVGGTTVNSSSSSVDLTSSGVATIVFDEAELIPAGESVTATLSGNIGGTWDDDSSIVIDLDTDDSAPSSEGNRLGRAYNTNIGSIVWSPNSLDKNDDVTASNTDWFSGFALIDSNDVKSWTIER